MQFVAHPAPCPLQMGIMPQLQHQAVAFNAAAGLKPTAPAAQLPCMNYYVSIPQQPMIQVTANPQALAMQQQLLLSQQKSAMFMQGALRVPSERDESETLSKRDSILSESTEGGHTVISGTPRSRTSATHSPRAASTVSPRKAALAEVDQQRRVGVVKRIGTEPLVEVEGMGTFRFAYRHLKKFPHEPRPQLEVGHVVECKFAKKAEGPVVVSIRLRQASDEPPALLEPEDEDEVGMA